MRKNKRNQIWLPTVALEIPELDEDHQLLLRRVNDLLAAVASRERAVMQPALGELRSETEAHFEREEALMREADYPDFGKHRARHHRLLRELGTLRVALGASERFRVPLAPVSYIRRWFAAHIARDDRMVASYLDDKEERFLYGLA